MSRKVNEEAAPERETSGVGDEKPAGPRQPWFHRLARLLFVFFCLEVGLFLVVFPWSHLWDANFFASFSEWWWRLWSSPYLRGAVSGLGLVNILVALADLLRLVGLRRSS